MSKVEKKGNNSAFLPGAFPKRKGFQIPLFGKPLSGNSWLGKKFKTQFQPELIAKKEAPKP